VESLYRSIVKALTWRTGGTVVTFAVAWILRESIDDLLPQVKDLVKRVEELFYHSMLISSLKSNRQHRNLSSIRPRLTIIPSICVKVRRKK